MKPKEEIKPKEVDKKIIDKAVADKTKLLTGNKLVKK